MATTVRARDCFVVDTAPLADAVRSFVTDWNRTRPPAPPTTTREASTTTFVSAVTYLAAETQRMEQGRSGRAVGEATIYRVVGSRSATTELWIADSLCAAMDRDDMLREGGELAPRENPLASRSCCGSLTGDGATR